MAKIPDKPQADANQPQQHVARGRAMGRQPELQRIPAASQDDWQRDYP